MLFMKIERINQNQIRCILTSEDLSERKIKANELAYGSEKTRKLFHEVVNLALREFNFETGNIPLRIEACPLSAGSVLLVITKVENPEELDPQFSQFSKNPNSEASSVLADILPSLIKSASDVIESMKQLKEHKGNEDLSEKLDEAIDISKLYIFHGLDDLISAGHVLAGKYHGKNTLFKASQPGLYHLVATKSNHTTEEFNKICNLLAEYGHQQDFSVGQYQYYLENFPVIEKENALAKLAKL